ASACQHVERVLAQGQPGDPGLAALEGLLEDEARQPLFLITARGERASLHQVLEAVEAGEFTFAELAAKKAPCSATDWVANYFARDTIKPGHAEVLRFLTEYVAIARLPAHEWGQPIKEMDAAIRAVSRHRNPAILLLPALPKIAEANQRHQARLRCASA